MLLVVCLHGFDARANHDATRRRGNDKPTHISDKRPAMAMRAVQQYQYLVVFNIETTGVRPFELIEFPVVVINTETFEVADQDRWIVQPTVNPTLTPETIQRTGVTQEMVDAAPTFPKFVDLFTEWMTRRGFLPQPGGSTFLMEARRVWWQVETLVAQCKQTGTAIPPWLHEAGDVCQVYSNYRLFGTLPRTRTLSMMLWRCGITEQPERRPYAGMEAAVNVARVAQTLLNRDCVFNSTWTLPGAKA